MRFPKDLCVIDFESSHGDAESSPVQFAAILLDADTLAEKRSFSSFVRTDPESLPAGRLEQKGFDAEVLREAPVLADVAQQFLSAFGTQYFLASWAADLDISLFKRLVAAAGVSFSEFDYHVYDIWPVAFTYLLRQGYSGSASSEEMFRAFGLAARGKHDALQDCRYAAAVLRDIV